MANKAMEELKNISAFKGVIGKKETSKKELPKKDSPKKEEEIKPEKSASSKSSAKTPEKAIVKNTNKPPVKEKAAEKKEENGIKEEKVQRGAGRPRKTPYVKRSLNIPENYISFIAVRAGMEHKGNINEYLISLVEKDMKENKELFEKISK